jgi:hypothetical protein
MWPSSLFSIKRLKLNKKYPLYSTLLHIFSFFVNNFMRGIIIIGPGSALCYLPPIPPKEDFILRFLPPLYFPPRGEKIYFWSSFFSPLGEMSRSDRWVLFQK